MTIRLAVHQHQAVLADKFLFYFLDNFINNNLKLIIMSYATQFLGKIVNVKTDRPKGSKHPEYGFIYPVNYGYIPGVKAPDGDELDAYVLDVFEPVKKFTGKCIAVIHRTNDKDDKLIVVPENITCSDDQIKALTEFQEKFFKSVIIRKIK